MNRKKERMYKTIKMLYISVTMHFYTITINTSRDSDCSLHRKKGNGKKENQQKLNKKLPTYVKRVVKVPTC